METNLKSLTITGTAAEDATRFRQKGSRRKRVKEPEAEPDTTENDTQFIEQVKKISLVKSVPVTPQVTQGQQVSIKPQAQPQPVQAHSNVILKPLKQPRVKLQPKTAHTVVPVSTGTDTTRKARRIHLSGGNLVHRFTRAKRLKDETEKKPMSSIRDYLVGKGVIQQKSKAPEKMLRSMYSDFMLLKDQAL